MSCPSVSTPHMSQSVTAVTHCGQLSTPRQPIPGGQPTQPSGSLIYSVNLSPLTFFMLHYAMRCRSRAELCHAFAYPCSAPPLPHSANQCQCFALLRITIAQPHCDLPRLSPAMRSNTLPCQCCAILCHCSTMQLPCYAFPLPCLTLLCLCYAPLHHAFAFPCYSFALHRLAPLRCTFAYLCFTQLCFAHHCLCVVSLSLSLPLLRYEMRCRGCTSPKNAIQCLSTVRYC